VLAVKCGEPKIVVAPQFGVSRQALHTWLTRCVGCAARTLVGIPGGLRASCTQRSGRQHAAREVRLSVPPSQQ
jgi:hypothetical protein